MSNRRNFVKNASIGVMASLSIPSIVSSVFAAETSKKAALKAGDIVLFQGDSITDWGRDKNQTAANNTSALGAGYVLQCVADLLIHNPDKNLQCYNKGISGNKVFQLNDRWDADCISLKPNVLSILVGVNDYWHTLLSGYKGTIDTYHGDYRKLIERTKTALPDISIIICEPFAVKGVKAVDDKWYPAFDAYRAAASDVAREYDLPFVPYQAAFDKALDHAPGNYWTLDGVHPSIAGAALMTQTWIKAVKG
jgi:lysophospholipase L1-like esterase